MRNVFVFVLAIMSCNIVFSQNFADNSLKYWLYRDRLRYFVYPGTDEGASVLMTVRNSNGNGGEVGQYNGTEWGQTRKINGYYIGLLATEYKLFLENGQNADALVTLNELDLALDALIRMDKCEDIEPWNYIHESFDGFFIRNDVPPVLSNSMMEYLNAGLPEGTYSDFVYEYTHNRIGYPFAIDPSVVLCPRMFESNSNYFYTNQVDLGGFLDLSTEYSIYNQKYWNYWYYGKFTSNDEIIGTLMGLSIVAKCVDYAPVKLKAINIAYNLVEFAKGWEVEGGFQMHYPNGFPISSGNGGNSMGLFYGMEKALQHMGLVVPIDPSLYALSRASYFAALDHNIVHFDDSYNNGMYIKLVSTGDAKGLHTNSYDVIHSLSMTKNWAVFYLMLWAVNYDKDLTKPKYDFPFDQLISDLNTAPCGGPYRYNYPDETHYLSVGWACEYKYDSDLAGQVGYTNTRTGVFPGVDYMLLYNLACLAFPSGFDYNGQHYSFPYYVNENNRKVIDEYAPLKLLGNPGHEISSISNPEEIRAITSILSNMIISNRAKLYLPTFFPHPNEVFIDNIYGDVTMKAGENIILKDGFRVDAGAHFLARIESYSCGGQSYKNMEAPPWDENYRGCFYDTLVSIPMDKRAPKVYSEDDYSVDDFDTPLWDDYYYTYDTTINPELEVGVWLNPNPCRNSSMLSLVSENDTYITIELFDMGGQKRATLFEGQSGTSSFELNIDMSLFAKGMYIVRIIGNGGTKVLKLVKE